MTFNLLWPPGCEPFVESAVHAQDPFVHDLGLQRLAETLNRDRKHLAHAQRLLGALTCDEEVIRYRNDALADLLELPALRTGLLELLPTIERLRERYRDRRLLNGLHPSRRLAWRLDLATLFIEGTRALRTLLDRYRTRLTSAALSGLLAHLDALAQSDAYQALEAEAGRYARRLERLTSVAIGINLSGELRPVEATILELGEHAYKPAPLLTRLMGRGGEGKGRSEAFRNVLKAKPAPTALEQYLFQELDEVFREALSQVEDRLARYIDTEARVLLDLEVAIDFYVAAATFVERLREAGMKLCKPEVLGRGERRCRIDGLYDLHLALELLDQGRAPEAVVVASDVDFGEAGRIFILTGPNQGGKTTYTRAIGTAQVLFQCGLFVPGERAAMSPVDAIFTHFLDEERPNSQEGKLAEESRRLGEIFARVTRHSLVLLNESLSSTSPGEALHLTADIVKGFRLAGCRAVFATHLHELARRIPEIEAETAGESRVISVVAGVERSGKPGEAGRRTYRIAPGPPQGDSLARDIARRYGIGFDQIAAKLRAEG